MKINTAQYSRSIYSEDDLVNDQKPQFLFIGRSNVGKSSLINAVTNTKNLCRTGKTPGVTKRVNLFLINHKFYIADLPGYGFALASKQDRRDLADLIYWYLSVAESQYARKIFILIDSRLGPTAPDLEIFSFLKELQLTPSFIISKCDLTKINQQNKIKKQLQIDFPNSEVIHFSSKEKAGVNIIRQIIQNSLSKKPKLLSPNITGSFGQNH